METNPGLQRPGMAVCRILCSNVQAMTGNLSDLTVALSQNDILLCSETLVSDMRHVLCRSCWFPDSVSLSCCAGPSCLEAQGMAAYVRDGYGAFCKPKFECDCCEILVFRVCGVRQNIYVFSLYHNTDLDDQIFNCLLASMVALQAENLCASFLFVGNLNGHHQEWFGPTTTNPQGVAAFHFATISGCNQLVVHPIQACSDLVRVAIVASIINSNYSSLLAVILMAQEFQTCVLVGKVSWNIKSIGILSVVQYGICPGVRFLLLTILLRFLMNICPCWLYIMHQPRSSVCTTMISLGLMINAGMLAFGLKQEAHLWWTRDCSRVNHLFPN